MTAPTFAAELLRLRRAAGLNGRQLALKAGLNASFLPRLERGERQAAPATVQALAIGLGLTPTGRDWLMVQAGHPPVCVQWDEATMLLARTLAQVTPERRAVVSAAVAMICAGATAERGAT